MDHTTAIRGRDFDSIYARVAHHLNYTRNGKKVRES